MAQITHLEHQAEVVTPRGIFAFSKPDQNAEIAAIENNLDGFVAAVTQHGALGINHFFGWPLPETETDE
jgi:hypothetical protein